MSLRIIWSIHKSFRAKAHLVLEREKEGYYMVQIWIQYGLTICRTDKKNQSVHSSTRPDVYSCARFSTLPLSDSAILDVAKIWPLYCQNMVLIWSFKWVLPESQSMCPGMFRAKFHIAGCILWPPFLEMAKIWTFYGPKIVLTWPLKWVRPES